MGEGDLNLLPDLKKIYFLKNIRAFNVMFIIILFILFVLCRRWLDFLQLLYLLCFYFCLARRWYVHSPSFRQLKCLLCFQAQPRSEMSSGKPLRRRRCPSTRFGTQSRPPARCGRSGRTIYSVSTIRNIIDI